MADVFVVGPRLAYTDGGCKFGRRPSWRCALFLCVDDTLSPVKGEGLRCVYRNFHLVIVRCSDCALDWLRWSKGEDVQQSPRSSERFI